MGLAISKQLITMMGGDITLESVVGEGSTFTVTIPVKLAEPGGTLVRGACGCGGQVPTMYCVPVKREARKKNIVQKSGSPAGECTFHERIRSGLRASC